MVYCCLGPSPLARLLSHWSYSTDSKTCLILVSAAGIRRHCISDESCPESDLSIILTVCQAVYSPHWLDDYRKNKILIDENLNIWSGNVSNVTLCQVDRGEGGTWYANYRLCAQVNMSVMSTQINLISNRKNCQAREHEEQSYAQTTVGLWNFSISLSASCQKKLFRKINYSYNL